MNEKALTSATRADIVERVITAGDLSQLSPAERVAYYKATCDSLDLNPLTRPFDYIRLNGKLTLYPRRDCTDQLRKLHNISIVITERRREDNLYIVVAKATMPDGRTDEAIGVVNVDKLQGDALANAYMKAETKAKRRVTLSIVGLGWPDESEVETIPDAETVTVTTEGEIVTAESEPVSRVHWIDTVISGTGQRVRDRFWAWTRERGLTEAEVYEALDVEHIHDFTGSMADAKAAIEAWIAAQIEAEAEGETHEG